MKLLFEQMQIYTNTACKFRDLWSPCKQKMTLKKVKGQCQGHRVMPLENMSEVSRKQYQGTWSHLELVFYRYFGFH